MFARQNLIMIARPSGALARALLHSLDGASHEFYMHRLTRERPWELMTGLSLLFLGTGLSPMAQRSSPALLIRSIDGNILWNAGDGTQRRLKESSVQPRFIDAVLIGGMRGEYIWGLPGLLIDADQRKTASPVDRQLPVLGAGRMDLFLNAAYKAPKQSSKSNLLFSEQPDEREFAREQFAARIRLIQGDNETVKVQLPLRRALQKTDPVWTVFADPVEVNDLERQPLPPPAVNYVLQEPDYRPAKSPNDPSEDTGAPVREGRKIVLITRLDTARTELYQRAKNADVVVFDVSTKEQWATAPHFAQQINARTLILTHFDNLTQQQAVARFDQESHVFPSSQVVLATDNLAYPVPHR